MTFAEAMAIASEGAQEVADVSAVLLSIDEVPEATGTTAAWADMLAVHHYVIDPLSVDALAELTRDLFAGERGHAAAAVGRLERAGRALTNGDRSTAGILIEGYSDFVTAHLGDGDAAMLVDLAGRLLG